MSTHNICFIEKSAKLSLNINHQILSLSVPLANFKLLFLMVLVYESTVWFFSGMTLQSSNILLKILWKEIHSTQCSRLPLFRKASILDWPRLCHLTLRPKKNICVFQVSALKKLGMVGQHNILFYRNILYRNCTFQYIFSHFSAN